MIRQSQQGIGISVAAEVRRRMIASASSPRRLQRLIGTPTSDLARSVGAPPWERGLQSAEASQSRSLSHSGCDGCKWTFLRRKRRAPQASPECAPSSLARRTGRPRSCPVSMLLMCLVALLATMPLHAGIETDFENGNRLFEQGKYSEAVTSFESILKSGKTSAAIYFNLANTSLKLGEFGRAVYYYQQANRLNPRDADVRANLRFVRHEVAGAFAREATGWQRFLRYFSIREWGFGTALLGALWFGVLAAREWKKRWRRALFWPARILGGGACVVGVLCFQASNSWACADEGVVIADQAELRPGPLMESRVFHKLRDGEEVRVLGAKDDWVHIMDVTQRTGWLKRDKIIPLSRIGLLESVVK